MPRFAAEGRKPVLRLRMPDEDLSWNDLVRGPTTFAAGTVPDFAITRGSGDPLYTLVNPVDDALMKITHVLRGEDILPSTPRQIALYQALIRIGVAERVPEFAHLPSVLGDGNKKLSKRDPQSNLFLHRDRGFIPEGLLNYLALLGWGIADDHDLFSLDEMVAAFDVSDVNSNPARFDQKKADAINAEHIRLLDGGGLHRAAARLLRRPRPRHRPRRRRVRRGRRAGADPHRRARRRVGPAEVPRRRRLRARREVGGQGTAAPTRCRCSMPRWPRWTASGEWTTAGIEAALKSALLESLELKPRKAFGPIRVAVTGASISPPLFESMELLGRERSLRRLRAGRDHAGRREA